MADDFSALSGMKYSGRGITIGMTPEGSPFVGYTLTGRSPSSQARRLVYDYPTSTISTDVTDQEQLSKGNPALLIYPAIVRVGDRIVASNGAQTRLLAETSRNEGSNIPPVSVLIKAMGRPVMEYGINITTYEPDAPNSTPRISGCLDSSLGGFHLVKKMGNLAEVNTFSFGLTPGSAKTITTYLGGNENPLLSFTGKPLEAKIESSYATSICESLYEAIGPREGNNYRVAAAVMMMKDGRLDFTIANRSVRGS